jgi:hypothetical protein
MCSTPRATDDPGSDLGRARPGMPRSHPDRSLERPLRHGSSGVRGDPPQRLAAATCSGLLNRQ